MTERKPQKGASRDKQNGKAPKVPKVPKEPTQLLTDVMAFLTRFFVATDTQRLVIALWVVHTHLVQHCEQTPYLSITSPEKQCGKTRVLETLEFVVARPWRIISPSDAVSYRYIAAKMPAFLLDEVDGIFANPKQHSGLRDILNAGHRLGAKVVRAADFGKAVEEFDCYCAKALAGIGMLPDTVADRSIYIRLQRKGKEQKVERLIRRDVQPSADALREQVAAWAAEYGEAIGQARPDMPQELSDRMEEGCESLVAIADALGYGDAARAALVELLTTERLDAHQTMRQRLLRDLRNIWREEEARTGRNVPALHTVTLLNKLHVIEDSPWSNYYGRQLDARDLGDMLRVYDDVRARTVNVRGKRLQGYRRDPIREAVRKYVDDDEQ